MLSFTTLPVLCAVVRHNTLNFVDSTRFTRRSEVSWWVENYVSKTPLRYVEQSPYEKEAKLAGVVAAFDTIIRQNKTFFMADVEFNGPGHSFDHIHDTVNISWNRDGDLTFFPQLFMNFEGSGFLFVLLAFSCFYEFESPSISLGLNVGNYMLLAY